MGKSRISDVGSDSAKPMVSIIIPAYDECDTIEDVFQGISDVFKDWKRDYEVIFVDDGSTDGTSEIMRSFPDRNPHVKIIRFARNFGQQAGVTAGFEASVGEYAIVMDADLQVDPADLPSLILKLDEGYDIVAGYRENRREGFITRRLPSLIVNRFFKLFFNLPYRDMGCGLQAYRKKYLEGLDRFTSMYGHMAIYSVWRGGRFADIPITYRSRKSGKTKYNWRKLLFFFLDIILTFTTRPIQLVVLSMLGGTLICAGVVTGLASLITLIAGGDIGLGIWILAMFLVLAGIQLGTAAIQNERINRISHRLDRTPMFVIDEVIENTKKSNHTFTEDK
ncbi:glycosyltransferase family 2 protein [bacterium]|nr:glycosyltransferase family 2 protein [candidate division CSSED10-310 bacterium]